MVCTGLEIAALGLAIFPLVIAGLEHYESGFQLMKEWVKFRSEFSIFMNTLARQRIFFRQNIEDLLSTVVESEYDMACMLDDLEDQGWKDPKMESRLRMRLSGRHEYECYMGVVSAVHDVLEKLFHKLKIPPEQPRWPQTTGAGFLRIEFEFKRFTYTLRKSRRQKLMAQLEGCNDDLRKLLGNSDKLEPTRRKRNKTPKLLEQFRTRASSLHAAITKAVLCGCTTMHSVKLRLCRDDKGFSVQSAGNSPGDPMRLSLYFALASQAWSSSHTLVGPDDSWRAAEIEMTADEDDQRSKLVSSSDAASTASTAVSKYINSSGRKVSFQASVDLTSSPGSVAQKDVMEIMDLCGALKQHDHYSQPCLGYICDNEGRGHTIRFPPSDVISTSQIRQVVTLNTLLTQGESPTIKLPRRSRLVIALVMAKSLLKLHASPWLKDAWSKQDIYFFRANDGEVLADHPLLSSHFYSDGSPSARTGRSKGPAQNGSRSSLLCLGILILELWFNQTIESRPFRHQFLGPNHLENEYTDFNTAQKWQEQALEEGGIDLHNLTRRCIYCAFGTASQDLNNEEFRNSVYDEIVEALVRLLARYEES